MIPLEWGPWLGLVAGVVSGAVVDRWRRRRQRPTDVLRSVGSFDRFREELRP